jgi:DNA replication initiation complex subunit (GINS family)
MDLTKDYQLLYEHWLKEFKEEEITPFHPENFKKYKENIKKLKEYQTQLSDSLKIAICKEHVQNFEFLFNDLFQLRRVKIINAALTLKTLTIENLLESEKWFFQNLLGTFKGFEKIKATDMLSEVENLSLQKSEEMEVDKSERSSAKESNDTPSESLGLVENYNYMMVRVLKDIPALVGIDLKNYGPFLKEDLIFIPEKNAQILIIEKSAEQIETK